MTPRRILLVHGKAEASFAHSKRFAQYDMAVHVGASRCDGGSRTSRQRLECAKLASALACPTPACSLESAGLESWKAVFVSGSMPKARAEAHFGPLKN